MKRSIAPLALALACLALAACASQGGTPGSKPAPTPRGGKAAALPSPAASPTPAPSPTPQRIPVLLKESNYSAGGGETDYTVQQWSSSLLMLLSRVTYDAYDDKPVTATANTFDAKGRLIASSTQDATGVGGGKISYAYDSQGRVIEERRFNSANIPLFTSRYEYNASGQRTSWMVFSPKERLIGITQYKYDKGLLVKTVMSDGEGNPGAYVVYDYDDKGRLLAREYYNADGSLDKKEQLTLGPGGTVTERTTSDGDTLVLMTTYEYERDTGALFRKILKNPLGAIKSWTIYSYAYREGGK